MDQIRSNDDEFLRRSANTSSLHVYVLDNFEKIGYENTQQLMRKMLAENETNLNQDEIQYLEKCIKINNAFEPYKDVLLNIVSKEKWWDPMESWVIETRRKSHSKKEIYEILSEFTLFFGRDPETSNNETVYDALCDFLERFVNWGGGNKILPDEPNVGGD